MRRLSLPLNKPLAIILLSLLALVIGLIIYHFQLTVADLENLRLLEKLKQIISLIVNPIVILWIGSGLLALTISYLNSGRGYRITLKTLIPWLLFGLLGLLGILVYVLWRGRSKNI